MNKDEQTDKDKICKIPDQAEQCDDIELRIKLLEHRRNELKEERQKKRLQELEAEVDALSQSASGHQQTEPQITSKVHGRIDCQVKVEKAMKNLTTETERRNDYKLQISTHENWGKLLTPAPMAISLLADLYFVSTKVDFDLKSQMPIDGFQYIKYPDSFRACLVQISISGWRAFNEAHTCMDQIRLMAGSVDTHVRDAVYIILDGTALEVEKCLPNILQTIDNTANENLKLAKQIELNFMHVMDLTGELLEVSISREADYNKQVNQLKAEKKDIKLDLEHETLLKEGHEKRLEKMQEEISLAQKNYEEVLINMPGASSVLGIAFMDGLVEAVNGISGLPTEIVKGVGLGTLDVLREIIQKSNSLETRTAEFNLMLYVPIIDTALDELQRIIGKTENEGSNEECKSRIEYIKSLMLRYQNKLSNEPADCGQLSKDIRCVCITGEEICINLQNCYSSIKTIDTQIISDIQDKFNILKQKTKELVMKYRKIQGRNPLDERPPCLPQRPIPASGPGLSTMMENARLKLEYAKNAFQDIQKKREIAEQQLEKNAKTIFEATKRQHKLNFEEVNFETIKTSLQNGISVLAEVREQWGKLVQFFSEISNLIKCCMNTSLKTFVKTISTGAELQAAGELMSKALRANMYNQTLQASRISFVVCDMATSYVSVSNDHIMPGVHLLQKAIGLSSNRHDTKIISIQDQLCQLCEKAQTSIYSKMKQEHQELEKQTARRMLQIQQELDELKLQN